MGRFPGSSVTANVDGGANSHFRVIKAFETQFSRFRMGECEFSGGVNSLKLSVAEGSGFKLNDLQQLSEGDVQSRYFQAVRAA
jgi:hypothetical protein